MAMLSIKSNYYKVSNLNHNLYFKSVYEPFATRKRTNDGHFKPFTGPPKSFMLGSKGIKLSRINTCMSKLQGIAAISI